MNSADCRLVWLVSRSQPHHVAAFLLKRAGVPPEQIANHHSTTRLRELLPLLQERLQGDPTSAQDSLPEWLSGLRRNMDRKFGDLTENHTTRKTHADLLEILAGETTFSQYVGDNPSEEIALWCDGIEELFLIAKSEEGDGQAFGNLYKHYEKSVRGHVNARVENEQDAKDVCENILLTVWEKTKAKTFDPAAGNFRSLVLYWRGIHLLRYFRELKDRQQYEKLLSELVASFPGFEGEQDIGEPWDAIGAEAPQSEDIPVEAYEELMRITFTGNSPPHQLLAFAFAKVIEWTPEEVESELSDLTLGELMLRLQSEFARILQHRANLLRECLLPLRKIMQDRLPFGRLKVHEKTLATYPELVDKIVADTRLRDYYTAKPESPNYEEQCRANITAWWLSVQKRVLVDIKKQRPPALSDWLEI